MKVRVKDFIDFQSSVYWKLCANTGGTNPQI